MRLIKLKENNHLLGAPLSSCSLCRLLAVLYPVLHPRHHQHPSPFMPGCEHDTCAPWLELSLLGDRVGSLFWGIMTWERSLCFGRGNRSKMRNSEKFSSCLHNFLDAGAASWCYLSLCVWNLWSLFAIAGILRIKGLHCPYFCSVQPHARWTGCMQFINKYLLFWAMTGREGISWLWIAGRVGICWLWSARRFRNLEVIITFSLCDPCPCLICTPVPYSRASLAETNTLLGLLPPPPCNKCLLCPGVDGFVALWVRVIRVCSGDITPYLQPSVGQE